MKVICIDANIPNILMPQLIDGKIYTVSVDLIDSNYYNLDEIPGGVNGGRYRYHMKRFAPLSTIDETELAQQRELELIKI